MEYFCANAVIITETTQQRKSDGIPSEWQNKRGEHPNCGMLLVALFHIQLNTRITVLVDDQVHFLDILIEELPLLCRGHVDACGSQGLVEHVVDIQLQGLIQSPVDLVEKGVLFDALRVGIIEVVYVAVEDAAVSQGRFHVRTALFPLDHHQEPSLRQGCDQTPVIGVTGHDDEGVHQISVVLHAGPGGHLNID